MRKSLIALVTICLAAAAQGPDAHAPAFDVASVKAAANPGMTPMICLVPCSPGERLTVEGARVDIRYMSLSRLILTAYRLKPYQLSGPDWMKTQRFDILAKIPEGGSKGGSGSAHTTLSGVRAQTSSLSASSIWIVAWWMPKRW